MYLRFDIATQKNMYFKLIDKRIFTKTKIYEKH